jgi:hypothetical protein
MIYATAQHLVVAEAKPDGLALLNLEDGQYFELNRVGAQVFRFAAAGLEFPAIVERLARAYRVPRDALEADARAILGQLVDRNLLLARDETSVP